MFKLIINNNRIDIRTLSRLKEQRRMLFSQLTVVQAAAHTIEKE